MVWPSLLLLLVAVLLLGHAHLAAARPPDWSDDDAAEAEARQQLQLDPYPVVVPKRTALVLDKMMVALQRALDDDDSLNVSEAQQPEQMDLQRRNQQKGRVYLRCYFNAVTCFRRKK